MHIYNSIYRNNPKSKARNLYKKRRNLYNPQVVSQYHSYFKAGMANKAVPHKTT